MVYTLVGLPEEHQLHKLNEIKNYFYQNGFRYKVSECRENVHITLLQLKNSLSENFLSQLELSIKKEKKITLKTFQILLQEHTWVKNLPEWEQKYPEGCGRLALKFSENPELISLAQKLRSIALKFEIDESLTYAKNIAQAKGDYRNDIEIFDYLANHMNLCNYIRLEKMDEAYEYFLQHCDFEEIVIDKIALVDDKQNIRKVVSLEALDGNSDFGE